ncbi:MAG: alpha/beta hydrolase [Pseudomonadota bacterium]
MNLTSPLRRGLLAAALVLSLSPLALAAPFASERISVQTVGSGSDVVLVPGLNSSPRVWAELLKAVPGHRYHLVHVNGFAGRPAGANAEGLVSAPVAEEVARYIGVAGLDKPAIIGHSMGGSIALMVAARHPQAVSKLMVVDMLPFLGQLFGKPGTTAESIKPTADAIVARMRTEDPVARRANAENTLKGMINTESMRAGAVEDSNTSVQDVSARAYHELIVTDLTPELHNIVVPASVLYVIPKGLPFNEAQFAAFYKSAYAQLGGVKLSYIPDAAHFLMWDQPARFQAEVAAFLDAK